MTLAKGEIKLKPTQVWRVDIIESERGWGRSIDAIKFFKDKQLAEEFVKDYNKDLPPGPAPDYYIKASGPHQEIIYIKE